MIDLPIEPYRPRVSIDPSKHPILIVEDDINLRELYAVYLSEQGFIVYQSATVREAMAQIAENDIHLVLCDYNLSNGQNGLDLLRQLAKLSPDLVFVMMTGRADQKVAIESLRGGAYDFLAKPFQLAELDKTLQYALERRQGLIGERTAKEELIQELARFPEDNPNPVLRVDRQGHILYGNRIALDVLRKWEIGLGERLPHVFDSLLQNLENPHDATEVICGSTIYSFSTSQIRGSSSIYLYGHDITAWKKAEKELVRLKNEATILSYHDQLTFLHNRSYLESHFTEIIRTAKTRHQRFALILIDLDNFKEINDIYGHDTGDQVLVQVARKLVNIRKENDLICRWGGDEILYIRENIESVDDVNLLCAQIAQSTTPDLNAQALRYPITLSLGYSIFPDHGKDLYTLFRNADQALYAAKNEGKNTWRGFHRLEKKVTFLRNRDLLLRFTQAVKEHQLRVVFQPLHNLDTGGLVGVEALARYEDPVYGNIPANQFISEAEKLGLIEELGRSVLTKSIRTLRKWHKDGFPLRLAVNISRQQILNPDLPSFIAGLLRDQGLDPELLVLEITERLTLWDSSLARERMEAFRALDIGLSIDDFGTGYSSLAAVANLPVSEVKIALELVHQIEKAKGAKVIQAIQIMTKALGLDLVAEGIETECQQEALNALRVQTGQGFHLSRPMAAEDLTEKLQSGQLFMHTSPLTCPS